MEGEKGCSGGTDGQGPVLLDVAQGPEQAVLQKKPSIPGMSNFSLTLFSFWQKGKYNPNAF